MSLVNMIYCLIKKTDLFLCVGNNSMRSSEEPFRNVSVFQDSFKQLYANFKVALTHSDRSSISREFRVANLALHSDTLFELISHLLAFFQQRSEEAIQQRLPRETCYQCYRSDEYKWLKHIVRDGGLEQFLDGFRKGTLRQETYDSHRHEPADEGPSRPRAFLSSARLPRLSGKGLNEASKRAATDHEQQCESDPHTSDD